MILHDFGLGLGVNFSNLTYLWW